ncbi:GAF domain-containing protein [Noviherbaspirillum malthae]|jgi:excisionase family DNA binding protein|uniref:GAF domain-containing protein n=1 Tax=Noviherbaspirillum malthae TaxID=1260987 RepID=UPI00188FB311|nr:GAF domain-containing protein [Noviherbaspirillum malthae]
MSSIAAEPDVEDPILTTRAVAAMLGVAMSTAQLWIESGAIPSWKTPGGHRRVRRSALLPLIESHVKAQGNGPESMSVAPMLAADYQMPIDPPYQVAVNESDRLKALASSGLIDTAPEQVFDRLTWLASEIAATPMALMSLVTARRQWFKSRIGLPVCETPREWAFCGHAILSEEPLIVNDAIEDQRFADNPLVTGEPHIRFYAGFPVVDRHRFRLGTLCVLDNEPKDLSAEQLRMLRELAAIASEEVMRRT